MMHPLRHFVSAPDGTNDALILADIEDKIGSHAENLTSEDKLAFKAVLSRYSYFLQWVEPDYSIGAALTDTMLLIDTTQDSSEIANATPEKEEIWNILLTLEGIFTEGASGLLKFITQQLSSTRSAMYAGGIPPQPSKHLMHRRRVQPAACKGKDPAHLLPPSPTAPSAARHDERQWRTALGAGCVGKEALWHSW